VPEYDAATGTWSKEHKLKLKIEKPPLSAWMNEFTNIINLWIL
jgi:hypothetical protein